MRATARRHADGPIRDRRGHRVLALSLVATILVGCETSVTPADRTAGASASASMAASAPSAPLAASASDIAPAPSSAIASAPPSLAPPDGPTASPSGPARADPTRFGFAAKGLKGEVMAFVTTSQVDDALSRLDFDAVSTIAFFSLEASSTGGIRQDTRWRSWTSPPVDQLIARAHATGTKVVISLARFSWSGPQRQTSVTLLSNATARARLATSIADEVVRRRVDGVNVDFEPIPTGQKANFTDLVRRIRTALDARGPGYQLTFDVVGHFESYDVAGALRPGGADAVYLMGYHFAGTFSTLAHGTAPLDGPGYSVSDAIRLLRRIARPDQIIVGVPYYGHVWPTATAGLRARTTGRGGDVTYDRARLIARAHPTSYDPVEEVRRVVWRQRDCATCPLHWVQLYFDDPRSLGAKWSEFQRQKLLGTGIWTAAFEGASGELTAALRRAWLVSP